MEAAYLTVTWLLLCGNKRVSNICFDGGGESLPLWEHWLSGRHNAQTNAIAAPSRIGRRKRRRAVICGLFRQERGESKPRLRSSPAGPWAGVFAFTIPQIAFATATS